jgi:HEAT repeat protein
VSDNIADEVKAPLVPLETWVEKLDSKNPVIRVRAAQALAARHSELSLALLVRLFDGFYAKGLGGKLELILEQRNDLPLFYDAMAEIATRAAGKDHDPLRSAAFNILGRIRDPRATPLLIPWLVHPTLYVRLHAAYALSRIADPSAKEALLQARATPGLRDISGNFIMAVDSALKSIGVPVV